MDNKKYCIYMHKNLINGKIYIGQTCKKPEYRWGKNGKNYNGSPCFFNAILEYGWNNFSHQILEENLSSEEANKKEMYYIQLYDSANNKKGYNIKKGYEELSQDSYNTIKKYKYAKHTEYYYLCVETGMVFKTTKLAAMWAGLKNGTNISDVCRGLLKHAGKHPETGERLSWRYSDSEGNIIDIASNNSSNNPNKKKVKCIETGKVFNSIAEAISWSSCGKAGIGRQIKGKQKFAGRHPETGIELHWEWVE